jgi:hypothetical protein
MPNWLTCKLTGRHEYSVWCDDGTMFLRCTSCGRRSQGWQVGTKPPASGTHADCGITSRTPAPIARLSVVRPD